MYNTLQNKNSIYISAKNFTRKVITNYVLSMGLIRLV